MHDEVFRRVQEKLQTVALVVEHLAAASDDAIVAGSLFQDIAEADVRRTGDRGAELPRSSSRLGVEGNRQRPQYRRAILVINRAITDDLTRNPERRRGRLSRVVQVELRSF